MDKVEQKILDIIDGRAQDIIGFANDIWAHAETGFKEFRTSQRFAEELEKLGLDVQRGVAYTGVKAYLKSPCQEKKGYTVALMGEMDALPMPSHPEANKETGAAHACGHNAQLTGVLGAAMALTDPEVRGALNGNVAFIGVPSEEFSADVAYKLDLIKQGKIGCCGGKSEMIRIGALDDIDITVGHHSWEAEVAVLNDSTNGFVNKTVHFKGKAAHSTNAHAGVDALEAATLAVNAINAQRETFRDEDVVRIHGRIVHGGDASNIIADDVELDYSIRGKTMAAIKEANYKVDRALKGAAMALGAGLDVETVAGYLPTVPNNTVELLVGVLHDVAPDKELMLIDSAADPTIHSAGSSDYGELSSIMPLIQFGTGGFRGAAHTTEYTCVDPQLAYVTTAKVFALCAYRLLKGDAAGAKQMLSVFKQTIDREGFVKYIGEMQKHETVEMVPVPDFSNK